MKKFLIKALLFCIVPLPLLYALDHMIDTGLKKSNNSLFTEWNDIFNSKINADLIIMGASRAWVHISPMALDTTLKINSYNIGIDGYPFEMQYARFKTYLQHNKKPKYIVHSIEMTTFTHRSDLYQYEQFIPYFSDTIIRNITRSIGDMNIAYYYFPLFKYNNQFALAKEGLRNYFKPDNTPREKYKGYCGFDKPWDGAFDAFKKDNPNGTPMAIEPKVKAQFEEYLEYCKNNGIQMIFVFTPQYIEVMPYITNAKEILALYDMYAAKYNIPYLNYIEDSISYNKANFYNSMHMNRTAADAFSKKLAADLQRIIH